MLSCNDHVNEYSLSPLSNLLSGLLLLLSKIYLSVHLFIPLCHFFLLSETSFYLFDSLLALSLSAHLQRRLLLFIAMCV